MIGLRSTIFFNRNMPEDYLASLQALFGSKNLECVQKETMGAKKIYCDVFPINEWLIPNSLIMKFISEKTNWKVSSFSFAPHNGFAHELYKAFGIDSNDKIKLTRMQHRTLKQLFTQTVQSLLRPEDLLDLEVGGCRIGIDIYESILRLGYPTVNLKNIETYRELLRGLTQYIYFLSKFENNEIGAIFTSHDNYIGPGILARMAYKFSVPVFLANPREINAPASDFQLYKRFQRYPEYFHILSESERKSLLEISENDLNGRISGKLNVHMPYQVSSAFEDTKLPRQFTPSKKPKILILAHDFFDNPHGYSRMNFPDFWHWLIFLGEISLKTNYDWYIKIHRDYSKIEIEAIMKFLKIYPNIKYVKPETSYHQLVNEGLDLALTCHGSAAHELPLLGVQVICAEYNPHVAYDFAITATSMDEYKRLLLNWDFKKKFTYKKNSISEFFAVHSYLMKKDDMVFPSLSEYQKISSESKMKEIDYLKANYITIKEKCEAMFLDAIQSKRVFSIEKVLPTKKTIKVPELVAQSELYSFLNN